MSTIALENPRLREYIKKTLKVERYGEPFATLLVEVFIREQQVLDLTPEEFNEDLHNFSRKVYKIGFEKMPEIKTAEIKGYYDNGKIALAEKYKNGIYSDEDAKEFFEIFSHECLHGMQITPKNGNNDYNRASGYDKTLRKERQSRCEIGTELIAYKITYNRDNYDFKANNTIEDASGYTEELFVIPLIASAFGLTEKEVLKYIVRSREQLLNALDKNIGDLKKTTEFWDKIEENLEYIHSMHYPDEQQIYFKSRFDEERQKAVTEKVLKIAQVSQDIFVTRIKQTPLDFDKDIGIQYKNDYTKMVNTIFSEFKNFEWIFERDSDYLFKQVTDMSEKFQYIKKSVSVFYQIAKDKSNGYLQNASFLVNAVRSENFKSCIDFGIKIDDFSYLSEITRADAKFQERAIHEDYNDFMEWDNREIFRVLMPNRNLGDKPVYEKSKMDAWNLESMNSEEGVKRKSVLRFVLIKNKNNLQIESRNFLFKYLQTPVAELRPLLYDISNGSGNRNKFIKYFSQESDKEFLAKFMAEKYVDKIYDFEEEKRRKVASPKDKQMQELLLSTIKTKGKEGSILALAKALINDDYQDFETEEARKNLSIIGIKGIYDTISEPMFQELLEIRDINPEKIQVFRSAISQIDSKYPGTVPDRIGKMIEVYRKEGKINHKLLSNGKNSKLAKSLNSRQDLEDMIGIMCNDFSNLVESRESMKNSSNDLVQFLSKIVTTRNSDNFRENMIKVILDNDSSGFNKPEYTEFFEGTDLTDMLGLLSSVTVQKSNYINKINEMNRDKTSEFKVLPELLGKISSSLGFSMLQRITYDLSNAKMTLKERKNNNERE